MFLFFNITSIIYIFIYLTPPPSLSFSLLPLKPTRSSKRSRFSSEEEERSLSSRSPRRSQRVTTVPQVRGLDAVLRWREKSVPKISKILFFFFLSLSPCRNSQQLRRQIKKPHRRLDWGYEICSSYPKRTNGASTSGSILISTGRNSYHVVRV